MSSANATVLEMYPLLVGNEPSACVNLPASMQAVRFLSYFQLTLLQKTEIFFYKGGLAFDKL